MNVDDALQEYRAARAKVDAAVSDLTARIADQLACTRGCSSCCTAGLSVLPVESLALQVHVAEHRPPLPAPRAGMCAFLDDDGACSVYAARPLLCRTHGLPLKTADTPRGSLRILDDVQVCSLNFTARVPAPSEILEAGTIHALLVTVDRRFRRAAGLPDDTAREDLGELARDLRGP